MPAPPFPFTPKSNTHLRPGQFWAIPLKSGRFAAGRVMAVPAFGPLGERPLELDGVVLIDPNAMGIGTVHTVWGWATIVEYAEEQFGNV